MEGAEQFTAGSPVRPSWSHTIQHYYYCDSDRTRGDRGKGLVFTQCKPMYIMRLPRKQGGWRTSSKCFVPHKRVVIQTSSMYRRMRPCHLVPKEAAPREDGRD